MSKKKSSYLPINLRCFNEILRKNVNYDNIKVKKGTASPSTKEKCYSQACGVVELILDKFSGPTYEPNTLF